MSAQRAVAIVAFIADGTLCASVVDRAAGSDNAASAGASARFARNEFVKSCAESVNAPAYAPTHTTTLATPFVTRPLLTFFTCPAMVLSVKKHDPWRSAHISHLKHGRDSRPCQKSTVRFAVFARATRPR